MSRDLDYRTVYFYMKRSLQMLLLGTLKKDTPDFREQVCIGVGLWKCGFGLVLQTFHQKIADEGG